MRHAQRVSAMHAAKRLECRRHRAGDAKPFQIAGELHRTRGSRRRTLRSTPCDTPWRLMLQRWACAASGIVASYGPAAPWNFLALLLD